MYDLRTILRPLLIGGLAVTLLTACGGKDVGLKSFEYDTLHEQVGIVMARMAIEELDLTGDALVVYPDYPGGTGKEVKAQLSGIAETLKDSSIILREKVSVPVEVDPYGDDMLRTDTAQIDNALSSYSDVSIVFLLSGPPYEDYRPRRKAVSICLFDPRDQPYRWQSAGFMLGGVIAETGGEEVTNAGIGADLPLFAEYFGTRILSKHP